MQIGGSVATAMGQPEIGIPMQMGGQLMGGGKGQGFNPMNMLLGNMMGGGQGMGQMGPMSSLAGGMGGLSQLMQMLGMGGQL